MAHKPEKKGVQPARSEASEKSSQASAVRHVGSTLESDPEYNEQPGRALSPQAALLSRSGNDLTASPDMKAASNAPEGTEIDENGRPAERLITHLAGDTSSDPHTDLGPDNATSVQHRGDRP